MQRKRLDSCLISDIKIQEKWTTHLNLRDNTAEFLEEKVGISYNVVILN